MYWNLTDEDRLIEAFRHATTPELMKNFINDILTADEKRTLMRRLKAVCMIKDGASYKQVEGITHLSSTTIARLSKTFANKEGGFQEILRKLNPNNIGYFD